MPDPRNYRANNKLTRLLTRSRSTCKPPSLISRALLCLNTRMPVPNTGTVLEPITTIVACLVGNVDPRVRNLTASSTRKKPSHCLPHILLEYVSCFFVYSYRGSINVLSFVLPTRLLPTHLPPPSWDPTTLRPPSLSLRRSRTPSMRMLKRIFFVANVALRATAQAIPHELNTTKVSRTLF